MRNIKKLIALILALCMALSLMAVTAYAEDDVRSEIGPPVAAPTQAELEEAELMAKALAETAKYLKLSVTQMNLKAGETYTVRVVPQELAKLFDWKINEEETKSANTEYLSVQEIDQQNLTITFKAEKSGKSVSLSVKLSNAKMDEAVAVNPALAKYATAAQKTLSKNMTCKVATVNTETKVVAGVGVTTTAVMPVIRPSGGGGVTVLPPSSGDGSTPPPILIRIILVVTLRIILTIPAGSSLRNPRSASMVRLRLSVPFVNAIRRILMRRCRRARPAIAAMSVPMWRLAK